jgi:hypothetical protein
MRKDDCEQKGLKVEGKIDLSLRALLIYVFYGSLGDEKSGVKLSPLFKF